MSIFPQKHFPLLTAHFPTSIARLACCQLFIQNRAPATKLPIAHITITINAITKTPATCE